MWPNPYDPMLDLRKRAARQQRGTRIAIFIIWLFGVACGMLYNFVTEGTRNAF